jgi:hypothetical protein
LISDSIGLIQIAGNSDSELNLPEILIERLESAGEEHPDEPTTFPESLQGHPLAITTENLPRYEVVIFESPEEATELIQ